MLRHTIANIVVITLVANEDVLGDPGAGWPIE
jgi:hypothetical protein